METQDDNEDVPTPKRKPSALKNNIEIQENDDGIPIPKRKPLRLIKMQEGDNTLLPQRKNGPQLQKSKIEAIAHSIEKKLAKCWSIPNGINYKKNFSIKIHVLLSAQGEVVIANIVDNNTYQKNALFRAVADNAMRAVYKCSPFTDLPSEHYYVWREITLNFILND
ncbi:hypothetical protein BIY23_00635 [Wolbachia pipientis]|uniref:Energy transducer TonB n=1 Tax=Wolbachia pipientis TaxID=955 RepID=A0A1E7QLU6_WOLPI|nr:hypothetical protein BIY23_00635 [Wolbachia pipientis]